MAIYIDPTFGSGGDGTITTPFDSWTDVTWTAGETYLQKRGTIYRGRILPSTSGSAGNYITIGAYGTGDKPRLYHSHLSSTTGEWHDNGSNIWYNDEAAFAEASADVGNVIVLSDMSCLNKKSSLGGCVAQGDFFSDVAADRLYMYSEGNPDTIYGDMECTLKGSGIVPRNYTTIENFDLRYIGNHGVNIENFSYINVRDCEFRYIGGSYLSGTTRYGNGMQIWAAQDNSLSNIVVERNKFYQIYDSAFGCQTTYSGVSMTDLTFKNNYAESCHWGCEIVLKGAGTTFTNLLIANNTLTNCGGWSDTYSQRNTYDALNLRISTTPGNQEVYAVNCRIVNNIIAGETAPTKDHIVLVMSTGTANDWVVENNLYYSSDGTNKFLWYDAAVGAHHYSSFAAWQAGSGYDVADGTYNNGLWADPLLTGYVTGTGSPCIDAGTTISSVTDDIDGTSRASAPYDIGCYTNTEQGEEFMGSFSDYLENKVLDHIFNKASYTAPSKYIALSTTQPNDTGNVTEPSGNGYTRIQHSSWNSSTARLTDNNGVVTFPQATGSWGTIGYWAIYDAASSGNLLAYGDLSTPKAVVNGNRPTIASGEIDISFDAGGISTYLANAMLNHIFAGSAYTIPTIRIALSTANPGDTGSGLAEPSGNNYSRVTHTGWNNAANGATDNSSQITFATPSGSWGLLTHMALLDAASGGNLLFYAALGTSQTPTSGDSVYFVTGALDFTLD